MTYIVGGFWVTYKFSGVGNRPNGPAPGYFTHRLTHLGEDVGLLQATFMDTKTLLLCICRLTMGLIYQVKSKPVMFAA